MSSVPPPILMTPTAMTGLESEARTPRKPHVEILLISVAVVILSFMLRVEGDRVALWFLPEFPLPQLCGARAFFGISCPGCGLTRSFIYLAHGRWHAAYHCHHLGWLLALMTVLQIPYRMICLARGPLFSKVESRWIGRMLIFTLIANWLLGLVRWPMLLQ